MKEQKFLLEVGTKYKDSAYIVDELICQVNYSAVLVKPLFSKDISTKIYTYIEKYPEIEINSLDEYLMSLFAKYNWYITSDYQKLMFYAWKNIDTAEAYIKLKTFS
jgi:hypothetical protein